MRKFDCGVVALNDLALRLLPFSFPTTFSFSIPLPKEIE
jgi:hypothetical protein